MIRNSAILVCLALWLAAVSCSDSRFTIDVNLENYAGNVRAFYIDDAGNVSTPVATVNESGWTLQGSSAEPTLVSIISSENQLLGQVVAQNGEHIIINGNAMEPFRHRISGDSKLSNAWADWRREHADLYSADDAARVNAAITEFIEKNPDNPLATILLVADFRRLNDTDGTRRLLAAIRPEARLQRLLATLDLLSMPAKDLPRNVRGMQLMQHGGEFETFVPQQHGSHYLLIFWDKDVRDRHSIIARARSFVDSHSSRVRAADILASPDTITWGNIIRTDSARWQHFWTPAGLTDQALAYLRLNRLPAFVAADSLGNILYQGHQLNPALDALKKELKK